MRTLLKTLLRVGMAVSLIRIAAMLVSKRFEEGSEVSDEFRRVICLDGADFISRAGGLRHAEISVILGGAKVDLRDAVLDPGGATVLLENTMGGLLVLVRDDWAVHVDDMIVGGGETEVRVTAPDELPGDAPRLHVQVITRLGSTVVRTGTGGSPG